MQQHQQSDIFRVFTTTAAPFDIELIQYDTVDRFVHAKLATIESFYESAAWLLKARQNMKLSRALYDLRRSPTLWHKAFNTSVVGIGFKPVPHERYCLNHDGILILFYVDGLVVDIKESELSGTEAGSSYG